MKKSDLSPIPDASLYESYENKNLVFYFQLLQIFRTSYRAHIFGMNFPSNFSEKSFLAKRSQKERDDYLRILAENFFEEFQKKLYEHCNQPLVEVLLGIVKIRQDPNESETTQINLYNAVFFFVGDKENLIIVAFDSDTLCYLTCLELTAEELTSFEETRILFVDNFL